MTKKTKYEGSSPALVELAWKLKWINETHAMQQRKLGKEFQQRSEALTDTAQVKQTAVFKQIASELGVPSEDYQDGRDWALNIENLSEGQVALVYRADASQMADNCDCPSCQLRRSLGIPKEAGKPDDDERPIRVH
jgi:hypothetical protein